MLAAIAETVFELGDAGGAGSAMKAVNQLLAGVHRGDGRGAYLGITQGIEPAQFLAVISMRRHQLDAGDRAPHVIDSDYTPRSQVDIWPKDLGIVLDIAAAPSSGAADRRRAAQFLAASGSGLGREDDAAVAKVYARNAGLTLPGDG